LIANFSKLSLIGDYVVENIHPACIIGMDKYYEIRHVLLVGKARF
jgi:hypothetical protein